MTVFTETYIPYEFKSKLDCYKYVINRALNIQKSLRFIEKDTEHLTVRCPVSADYLDIVGTQEEIEWLHTMLKNRHWYTPQLTPFFLLAAIYTLLIPNFLKALYSFSPV